jgi:hypothetical protein
MPAKPKSDCLERLWDEVINLDPKGDWLERSLQECQRLPRGPYAGCAAALKQLQNTALMEDLGRVSRSVRYETCFALLYSFAEAAPAKKQLASILKLLPAAAKGPVLAPKLKGEYVVGLREMLDAEDDGQWLLPTGKGSRKNDPFSDVPPAVKRLLKAGATLAEMGRLAAWSRYEACLKAHQIFVETGLGEEAAGLHEILLGADPSGKEGRPGSWPWAAPAKVAGVMADPRQPHWRVRSGQSIAFSPDSKLIAIGGASGPARLYDVASGEERVTCEGVKAHIFRIAFSPDGQQVAIAMIDTRVSLCDAVTGKLAAEVKFSKHEISSLIYSAVSGDLLRSSWCSQIEIYDPRTGQKRELPLPTTRELMVNAMVLFAGGEKLAAAWNVLLEDGDDLGQHQCTIWSWPQREVLLNFTIRAESIVDLAASPDGSLLALPFNTYDKEGNKSGIHLINAKTGKIKRTIPLKRDGAVVFSPKEGLLFGDDDDDVCCWNAQTGTELYRWGVGSSIMQLDISPDGEWLAAATSKGALVWRLKPLLANVKI